VATYNDSTDYSASSSVDKFDILVGILNKLEPDRQAALLELISETHDLYLAGQTTMSKDLADTLKRAILKAKMSQYQLALQSGVPASVIYRFVTDERGITLTTASKLAGVLGLKLMSPATRKNP